MRDAPFSVYDARGAYVASCVCVADARVLTAIYGAHAEVRWGHEKRHAIWVEGIDSIPDGQLESWAVRVMVQRVNRILDGRRAKEVACSE